MLSELENSIGYKFKNIMLLEIALTHSSYANESNHKECKNYERLEFLGDAVLGLVTADYIFNFFSKLTEGDLTKLRSSLVCERTLCKFSKMINVDKYIRLSKGERRLGGHIRPSILADVFESIVAAIYIDGGLKSAEQYILKFIKPEIKNLEIFGFQDYKTELQEIIQKNPDEEIKYQLINVDGPDHNKIFTVQIKINNNIVGKGQGHSKKEAEQAAAHEVLGLMGY